MRRQKLDRYRQIIQPYLGPVCFKYWEAGVICRRTFWTHSGPINPFDAPMQIFGCMHPDAKPRRARSAERNTMSCWHCLEKAYFGSGYHILGLRIPLDRLSALDVWVHYHCQMLFTDLVLTRQPRGRYHWFWQWSCRFSIGHHRRIKYMLAIKCL